jgi:hypothetical protein
MSQSSIAIKLLSRSRKARQIQGTTLAEALVAIVVIGILSAIAAPNILAMGSKPLPDAMNQIAGQFRSMRAKAIAQTTVYRIRPTNSNMSATVATCASASGGCVNSKFIVERLNPTSPSAIMNTSCDTDSSTLWVRDNNFTSEDLSLASGITVSRAQINPTTGNTGEPTVPTNWQLCFSPRGIADKDLAVTLQQADGSQTQQVEIFPGGTVQVYAIQNSTSSSSGSSGSTTYSGYGYGH